MSGVLLKILLEKRQGLNKVTKVHSGPNPLDLKLQYHERKRNSQKNLKSFSL